MRKILFGLLAVTVIMMTGCKKDDVKSITLNQSEITIIPTQTTQLSAEADPSDTQIVWTSDNVGVATVSDQGLVTAVSDGVANITAASKDGKKQAVCKVTVDGKVEGRFYVNKKFIQYVDLIVEQSISLEKTKQYAITLDKCVALEDAEMKEIRSIAAVAAESEDELDALMADLVAFPMVVDVTELGYQTLMVISAARNAEPFQEGDTSLDMVFGFGQKFHGDLKTGKHIVVLGVETASLEQLISIYFEDCPQDGFRIP